MTAFVDASFLFALFNRDDEFYPKAIEIAGLLKESATRLLTSNIVLAETVNLVFRDQGPKAARDFAKSFRKSKVEEFFVSDELFKKAYQLLFAQKTKQGLNFFDCLHLVTMKALGIETILSFDKGFKKEVKVIGV